MCFVDLPLRPVISSLCYVQMPLFPDTASLCYVKSVICLIKQLYDAFVLKLRYDMTLEQQPFGYTK